MSADNAHTTFFKKPAMVFLLVLVAVGLATFIFQAGGKHPEKAWQIYLINFVLFSGIAQGAVLFSTLMHITRARWSGPLASLAEAFTAFFPVSLVLFILMLIGHHHVFPWSHHDLHGKEVWLNVPFLFTRDIVGMGILYGFGFIYLFHALWLKLHTTKPRVQKGLRGFLASRWQQWIKDEAQCRRRMDIFSILYMLAFALVLSLLGFDLIMATDPHWYSTLFGAYSFIKAVYVGFGSLIILAAFLHLYPQVDFNLQASQFHDIGKLFFAFCLVWADFFYCQFVVIWYGNISEETAFMIERVYLAPWNTLAWSVFVVCFIAPFLILLNRNIKTKPLAMSVICSVCIIGMWFEAFLVTGPAFNHGVSSLPLHFSDALISLGFLSLLILAVFSFLNTFPEILKAPPTRLEAKEVH